MNTPSTPNHEAVFNLGTHLLDSIRAVRASVGDGLNDSELTRLLRWMELPTEAGFAFLSFSGGFVTLAVPRQDPADWYPEKGWITAEKERIARALADKHGLSLDEPPDETPSSHFQGSEALKLHHHLELGNCWETVIAAHPCYLKIRLFEVRSGFLYARTAQSPVPLPTDLLHDLAALYHPLALAATSNPLKAGEILEIQ
jgi:hypothetical protein